MDSNPRDRHDPNGVFKYRDGENPQDEAYLFPSAAKDKLGGQQAGNQQGQPGVNAAALLRNLDIDARQRKHHAAAEHGHSKETEQDVAGLCRTPLENGYQRIGQGHWKRDHKDEEQQRKHCGFKGASPITSDEHTDPRHNDQGRLSGQSIGRVQGEERSANQISQDDGCKNQRYADGGGIPGAVKNPPSLQPDEEPANEWNQRNVGGVLIAERKVCQTYQGPPKDNSRYKPQCEEIAVLIPKREPPLQTLPFNRPGRVCWHHSIDNRDDRGPPCH